MSIEDAVTSTKAVDATDQPGSRVESAERHQSPSNSRVPKAETAKLQAPAPSYALSRRQERATLKVAQLRRALEAVGLESHELREIADSLTERYQQAIDELIASEKRRLGARLKSLFAGRGKRSRPTHEEAQDILDLRRSIYFDADWYLQKYPDVREQKTDPALHYLRHGARELRDPGPWFSTAQYIRNNPDVGAAGANPLLHYQRHGLHEGRTARTAPRIALPSSESAPDRQFSCIFITGEPESPGHRYRVQHFIEATEACGGATTWVRADDLATRHEELTAHDVAIFWRVAWTDEVAAAIAWLQAANRTVVFDVDDLMTEPDLARLDVIDGIRTQSLTEELVRKHYTRVRRTMQAADVCLTTTEELAYHLRFAGKTTYVVPNGFDRRTHDLARLERRKHRAAKTDDLIRIGYAGGSHTHQRDFAVAAPALARILRENAKCRLVLFKDSRGPLVNLAEFSEFDEVHAQVEWRDAVPLPDLPRELARFDINIAPLQIGNPFCEAKSELKFFEAALADVPTVASPTGPFRRSIDHGRTGYLAASGDDWYHQLGLLVASGSLRAEIGRAAYYASLARFGPESRTLHWGCVLEELKGGLAAARGFALRTMLAARQAPAPKVFPSRIVLESDKGGAADVTVVVPLYNYQDYIEETLDTVREQSADLLDLVVVDGFSTDNSLGVAEAWAKRYAARFNRIIVMQNEANYGLGYCRNSGVDAAETPYVLFLDADNKLLPNAYTAFAERLQQTSAAFAYSTLQSFGASSALIGNAPYSPQRLVPGNYIDALAIISKEAWAMAGGIEHVRYGWEDYDLWCRFAELGLRGEWIEEPLAMYRVHQTSMQATQTKVPENLRRLMEDFKARHPWTSLIDQERSRTPPSAPPELTPLERRTRLDQLLPILRCPETGQQLGYNDDRTRLISYDGLRSWPILDGRPLLSQLTLEAEVHPVEHVSNSLPAAALDLIREGGLVLNLSAGGTSERFDNVVEAEFSVFRHTDVAVDAHELPFQDAVFDAVIVLNAFEHYRDPLRVAAELRRVLKPGGKLLVMTAFIQPVHEKPHHFYNCTRYGLEEWFSGFELETISVTDNFAPNFSLGWIASEAEASLRTELGEGSATALREAKVGDFIDAFRDQEKRCLGSWESLAQLSQPAKETIAAGFEFIGRKADGPPVIVK